MAPGERGAKAYSNDVVEQKATLRVVSVVARPFFNLFYRLSRCRHTTTTNLIYQTPFVFLPLLSCTVLMRLNDCWAALGTIILLRSAPPSFMRQKLISALFARIKAEIF
jgi:hypothetical protein